MVNAWRIARWIILAVLVVGIIFYLRSCGAEKPRQEAAQAQADTARADGQVKAATDATGITADVLTNSAAIDQQTRESENAIRRAPGAEAILDVGVADAGRRAVCMRRAAARDPVCARLLNPGPTANQR
ncbi:hypothetical protein ABC347_07680 [Sphingomonas sp. 1P06PA]|uniref:hypothetical protein n=1 Tax=Sphingomonas sp. 1P06PA TaxID=554121 RepID=UPI0039A46351